MTIQELDNRKAELLSEVNVLSAEKKRLYSSVDIESPMSTKEKELNDKIAKLFSEINAIVAEKRKLKNAA